MLMPLTHRLSASLISAVGIVSLSFAFFQTRADTRGLRRDLENHAQVLAESLARSAEPLVERHANRELQRLVDRFKDRERISGVSVYDAGGKPLAITSGFTPRVLKDPALAPITGAVNAKQGPTYVPIRKGEAGPPKDSLVVCHPLRTVDECASVNSEDRFGYVTPPGGTPLRFRIPDERRRGMEL